MKYQPIIIIGAPRSGTNILRNTLSVLPDAGTWDCDEIPYIWRYGNKKFPTDLLTPDMVSPKIQRYIRSQFEKISKRTNNKYVIEKTCANSLRVGFVDRIFPEAKYIFIIRNGIDVVSSSIIRWRAQFELSYTLKKMKYVPKLDIPYYWFEYLNNRLHKKLNNDRLKFWGPKFMLDEELKYLSLEKISALQWVSCVENSHKSFNVIDDKKVFRLKYENFVSDPLMVIEEIAEFVGLSVEKSISFPSIKNTSIGKGSKSLRNDQLKKILPIIKDTMDSYNYLCPGNEL